MVLVCVAGLEFIFSLTTEVNDIFDGGMQGVDELLFCAGGVNIQTFWAHHQRKRSIKRHFFFRFGHGEAEFVGFEIVIAVLF